MSWIPAIITLGGELIGLVKHLVDMRRAYGEGRDNDALAALDAARVELERVIMKRKRGG